MMNHLKTVIIVIETAILAFIAGGTYDRIVLQEKEKNQEKTTNE